MILLVVHGGSLFSKSYVDSIVLTCLTASLLIFSPILQMMDLSDIARCGASTDLSKEGSCDYLLACMQDIQAVLKQSKLKALVIDTFGGRIEKLLW